MTSQSGITDRLYVEMSLLRKWTLIAWFKKQKKVMYTATLHMKPYFKLKLKNICLRKKVNI